MRNLVNKWRNRMIAMTSDVLMIPFSWCAAAALYSGWLLQLMTPSLLLLLIGIQGTAFITCGLYRGMWRFASIPDLIRILRSVAIGFSGIFFFIHLYNLPMHTPILCIYSLILILSLSGTRILFRWLRDYQQFFVAGQRVLIVGAGSAGEGIVRDLHRLSHKEYSAVAFVDDNQARRGREIQGVRVLGSCQDIPALVKKLDIQLILITVPSAKSTEMRRIVSYCEQAKVPFRTLPGLKSLAEGRVNLQSLREVLLEDLLGREQVQLEWTKIGLSLENKTILVTGGGGSIGSELCRQIASYAPGSLIVVDSNEYNLYNIDMELKKQFPHLQLRCRLCNVADRVGMRQIFTQHQPALVFHAAAYKHVPLLETQLRVAIHNNIIGTRIVGELASEFGVQKCILISTDKAVNPTNVMGATKRASEVFCQNMNFHSATNFITVRFGNVLDSAGSVVPLFRKQLSEGGPLTVTHPEITRFFMTIPESTQLILQSAVIGQGGEIFVLDMGEPIKIRYLAEQMIKLSGKILGEDIEICYTGLRPGEKLYEELFHSEEELCATTHTKIKQAKVRHADWKIMSAILDRMTMACDANDELTLNALLRELVPEYNNDMAVRKLPTQTSDEECANKSLSYA